MNIQLRFFASIREAVGTGSESLSTPATTLAALRDELIARGGPWAEALGRERAVRVSLNQTMADEAAALVEGAEVAFFPPVTGG
ncbi:molybdopterin converting factor subunit 1 [Hydrogenophaga sp. R2]|uniref:molybdopterin converting factor subunit 1 n=1 Tax=Hydrogenophaga sp. R2 TaxID=3132827 RepID=UPI003CEF4BE2